MGSLIWHFLRGKMSTSFDGWFDKHMEMPVERFTIGENLNWGKRLIAIKFLITYHLHFLFCGLCMLGDHFALNQMNKVSAPKKKKKKKNFCPKKKKKKKKK